MKTRVLLGTLLVLAFGGLLLLDHFTRSPFGFLGLCTVAVGAGVFEAAELYRLALRHHPPAPPSESLAPPASSDGSHRREQEGQSAGTIAADLAASAGAALVCLLVALQRAGTLSLPSFELLSLAPALLVLLLLSAPLWTRQPRTLVHSTAWVAGTATVLLPTLFLVQVRFLEGIGPAAFLFLVLVTKTGDSAAYFTGRAIGRHPLSRLSPRKTIEGSLGGLLVGLAFGLGLWALTPLREKFSFAAILLIALLVQLAAQLSDLLESALKRAAEVKDSSRLMPEFGGALDVIDSFLLSGPLGYVLFVLFSC